MMTWLDDLQATLLAGQHETPAFVYSAAVAVKRYQSLRAVLPGRVRVAYAVKANPHPVLLRALAAEGASFDCASAGELARAVGAGGTSLFYAGPAKRTAELARALALKVRVQAEGWDDLARLDALATGPVAVNLRVHPAFSVVESTRILGGTGPSAFGVDEEDLPELLERAQGLRHVRIAGLHVFAASNERQAERLLETYEAVFQLGRRLVEDHHLDLQQIDVGGGLGVPYADHEEPLDLQRLGHGIESLLARHEWFQGDMILEPGRYLAAECGCYLSRVVRVKQSRGQRFVMLEGGVNHLLRPLLTGQAFPVRALNRSGKASPAVLAGPLCTSLDRLGEVLLPEVAPGDCLVFERCGAYGFTESMAPFLSHPVPLEIWVDDVGSS